ncbi:MULTISPECIES: hypothetical protein [unclassified Frankia]|nr:MULTISPECIES: hypothetical protein [unclassified Frankia]
MDTDGDLVPEPRGVPGAAPTPLAEVVTVRHGLLVEHELVLAAGATAADLTSAMIVVPPRAALVNFHGDVDLSLVFREVPGDDDNTPGQA